MKPRKTAFSSSRNTIHLILLHTFFIFTSTGYAQFAPLFKSEQISIDEGLSQVSVTCILKDSNGSSMYVELRITRMIKMSFGQPCFATPL